MTRAGSCFRWALAASVFGLLAAASSSAPAQTVTGFEGVTVADLDGDKGYRPVRDNAYAEIRQDMIIRKVLEEYVAFMSPVRLPKGLWVYADECGGGPGSSPYYDPSQRAIVMCYEFVKSIDDWAAKIVKTETENPRNVPIKVTRKGFIAGLFAGVILHETGHALFDNLDVPIFGRQEDAADQMSTFIAVQFKPEVADLVVGAYANVALMFDNKLRNATKSGATNLPDDPEAQCQLDPFCAFSDEHGTWGQRFFNTLCLAYGANPTHYADLVGEGFLPNNRDCVAEYEQTKRAFAATIYPFIDKEKMKKVQEGEWFMQGEMK
jgi:hypothetical protein